MEALRRGDARQIGHQFDHPVKRDEGAYDGHDCQCIPKQEALRIEFRRDLIRVLILQDMYLLPGTDVEGWYESVPAPESEM